MSSLRFLFLVPWQDWTHRAARFPSGESWCSIAHRFRKVGLNVRPHRLAVDTVESERLSSVSGVSVDPRSGEPSECRGRPRGYRVCPMPAGAVS